MSATATAWAWKQEGMTPGQKMLLLAIADEADDDGVCWPGQKRLAAKCSTTDRTIRDQLKGLEEKGLVTRTRRERPDGSRTSDLIQLGRARKPEGLPEESSGPTGNGLPGVKVSSTGNDLSEEKGGTKNGVERGSGSENSGPTESELIQGLYERWLRATDRTPGRWKLTPERRTKLKARLGDSEVEEIQEAIDNIGRSAFHRGQNDRGQRYDDLTQICRSRERIEQYRDLQPDRPNGKRSYERPVDPEDKPW